jgi:hypothetical protein
MSLPKIRAFLSQSDPRVVLSTTWVFVLMNMIYADILNTLKPGYLSELADIGQSISEEMVLAFAFLMEIPIAMILLSRVLNREANRFAHFIAAPISILWVIVPSLLMDHAGTPLSYLFFASIETLAMLFMVWYAWKWKNHAPSSI